MPDPSDLDGYARAAARLARLEIEEAWWPGVIGHLAALLARAGSLDSDDLVLPEAQAPVFQPVLPVLPGQPGQP